MKYLLTLFCLASFFLFTAGCAEETPAPSQEVAKPSAQQEAPGTPQAASPGKAGKVVETMDAAGYTYVKVDTGSEQFWAAAPQFDVKVDDEVLVPEGMPMANYHSKTLDRTFEMVYFVPAVMIGGEQAMAQGGMPPGHPEMKGGSPTVETTDVDLSGIAKAEGGQTIAEIYAQKAELTGKEVKFRGKVVKFSPEIMGKNWLHIQDGTGESGMNDLTVTSMTTADVGDTVVISGTLAADKDFGYGYQYDLIVEDAQVTVE